MEAAVSGEEYAGHTSWPHGDWLSDYDRREGELVLFTTRIPSELFYELKKRALRSTMQILAEHAYTLYLGGRPPPDLWGGEVWLDAPPSAPKAAYLNSKHRQFSVRIPRTLHRRLRGWAVKAELTDQELAAKVFDWYVRSNHLPPYRDRVKRGRRGELLVDEPLLSDRFDWWSDRQLEDAYELLIENHTKYGGRLSSEPKSRSNRHSTRSTDAVRQSAMHRENAARQKPGVENG